MSEQQPTHHPQPATQGETYTHGYSQEHQQFLAMRSAARDAAFFLPYLRPGMRLLDCGCGVGSISVGLAEAVAPGEAVGMDIDERQLAAARTLAEQHGAQNLSFVQGSSYALPFPDASFDAVFANTVLEHLHDPLAALREMRRVLRPGGVAGVRDPYYPVWIIEPEMPLVTEGFQLFQRAHQHNGGSGTYSRHLRALMRQAGFARTVGGAEVESMGEPRVLRVVMETMGKGGLQDPAFRDLVASQGWADDAKLQAIYDGMLAWAEDPDALFALMFFNAVGFVDAE